MDEWIDGWMDGQTCREMSEWMDECMEKHRDGTVGQIDRQKDGCMQMVG